MANPLYSGLDDDFNRHDGSLSGYVDENGSSRSADKHYDLRAFHTTNLSVPWTSLDNTWWNGFKYPTYDYTQIGTPRSIVNIQSRKRTQAEMDTLTQGTSSSSSGGSPVGLLASITKSTTVSATGLDSMDQNTIENVGVTAGNEEWPTSGITVGKDSAYRYSNTIRVPLTGGVTSVIDSHYTDDIFTDFSDASLYSIEMVLRAFPSQADAAHLDLTNSWIEISSDESFDPSVTDKLYFSNSLSPISGTTGNFDTYVKWSLASITKADRSNIKGVRLNLLSVGSMTFIAQALRVTPVNWTYRVIGLDTKRKTLTRQVPKAGGSESASVFGDLYFAQTLPKNVVTTTRFNSGHLPATGTDDNTLRQYYRHDVSTGDKIEVRISSRSTQTRLYIDEKIAGATTNLASTSINTNILTAETDYYLVCSINGTTVTATVYTTNGLNLGSQVGTLTLTATTSLVGRGYMGYSFEPYYYDFSLRFLGTGVADFGQFLSANFLSRSPVLGATLYTQTSATLNMINGGEYETVGDATLSVSTDNLSTVVTRAGTTNQGGMRYDEPIYVGESGQVVAQGSVFPVNLARGTYRLGLIDENDSVVWIYNLPSLNPNQWNDFSILLPIGLSPVSYYFHFQQLGAYPDTFYVRDLALNAPSIAWEGTSDAGTHWQPFFNVINGRFTAVNFANPGKSLAVRATAKSSYAYIHGYNLVPRYVS